MFIIIGCRLRDLRLRRPKKTRLNHVSRLVVNILRLLIIAHNLFYNKLPIIRRIYTYLVTDAE